MTALAYMSGIPLEVNGEWNDDPQTAPKQRLGLAQLRVPDWPLCQQMPLWQLPRTLPPQS